MRGVSLQLHNISGAFQVADMRVNYGATSDLINI